VPVFDIDPGTSPEAPGTLSFYEQGQDPSTGFQVTSKGVVSAPGGQSVEGDQAVGGNLTVDGYTALQAGQADGTWNLWSGTPNALNLGTAGGGVAVKEGTDARMGVATLVGGTVTVANESVTADTRIFLTAQNTGGTPGALRVSARVAGTSFTITSSSGADTSTVAWLLVEPAA
jgi:hypothetical protein